MDTQGNVIPLAPLIVKGANPFISSEARQLLFNETAC
jgi:hypothetical protein